MRLRKRKENKSAIREQAEKAKQKSYQLGATDIFLRNRVLNELAQQLRQNRDEILLANEEDVKQAEKNRLSRSLLDRLKLTEEKIEQMAVGVEQVAKLQDPLGAVEFQRELAPRLVLTRYTVPIGLIGVIFESRPDALIQIASLAIKSGNCAVLKGGKEAAASNKALYRQIETALKKTDPLFEGTIVLAQTRADIDALLALDGVIDLMIPRGSNALVKYIQENSRIPVLGHADGICHLYVDNQVDIEEAVALAEDSKCQYPAVCNAIETLLVHSAVAEAFLPLLAKTLNQVELRGDGRVCQIIDAKPATEADWSTEYNDLILSIKVVSNMNEAIAHINRYGSHHTDAIASKSESAAHRFMTLVDSSSVIWNSSTRFADGFRYGFGAEVGISTNKIHARGPVGLEGLTIHKYRLSGRGHCVRPFVEGDEKFTHKDLLLL